MDQHLEPTLEESVKEVFKQLPPVIRTYLAKRKYTAVVQNVMHTYRLRVDQGGVLERELLFLLMGIKNPDEFRDALVVEGVIPEQTVSKILQDVNTQVFIPLRAAERASAAVPEQKESHFRLQNKIQPQPRLTPQSAQGAKSPRPDLRVAVRQALSGAKPLDSSRLLEDHEEPHIEFSKPFQSNVSGQEQKAPASSPRATPNVPPNLPGAMSSPNSVRGGPPGTPPPQNERSPSLQSPTPKPPSSYTVDPYREPIDEIDKG